MAGEVYEKGFVIEDCMFVAYNSVPGSISSLKIHFMVINLCLQRNFAWPLSLSSPSVRTLSLLGDSRER